MVVPELVEEQPRTRHCRRCDVEINAASARCPYCGARQYRRQPILGWRGALVCLVAVAAAVIITRQIVETHHSPASYSYYRSSDLALLVPEGYQQPVPRRPARHGAGRVRERRAPQRHRDGAGDGAGARDPTSRLRALAAPAAQHAGRRRLSYLRGHAGRASRAGCRCPRCTTRRRACRLRRVRLRRVQPHDRGHGHDLGRRIARCSPNTLCGGAAVGQRDLRRPGLLGAGSRRHGDPARAAPLEGCGPRARTRRRPGWRRRRPGTPSSRSGEAQQRVVEAHRSLDHREVAGVLEDLDRARAGAARASQTESATGTSMSSRPCTISAGTAMRGSSSRTSWRIIASSAGASPGAPRPAAELGEHVGRDPRRMANDVANARWRARRRAITARMPAGVPERRAREGAEQRRRRERVEVARSRPPPPRRATIRSTRCGKRSAISAAMKPPIELPDQHDRARARAGRRGDRRPRRRRGSRSPSAGICERPKPGRSSATTRRCVGDARDVLEPVLPAAAQPVDEEHRRAVARRRCRRRGRGGRRSSPRAARRRHGTSRQSGASLRP